MLEYRGLMFPDGEKHIPKVMDAEGLPIIDGKPTFQYRKYKVAKRFVQNWRHAVDVGSHVGLWSRVMIKNFQKITAFEPVQECRDCFEVNIPKKDRERITLHPFAIGAEEKDVSLNITLDKSSGWTHVANNGAGQRTVQMRTLDSFNLTDVDFLKIDVEGYEWFVIKGAEQMIRRDKPVIIVEQKEGSKDRYGLKFRQAVELLQQWGAHHECELGGDHIVRW